MVHFLVHFKLQKMVSKYMEKIQKSAVPKLVFCKIQESVVTEKMVIYLMVF